MFWINYHPAVVNNAWCTPPGEWARWSVAIKLQRLLNSDSVYIYLPRSHQMYDSTVFVVVVVENALNYRAAVGFGSARQHVRAQRTASVCAEAVRHQPGTLRVVPSCLLPQKAPGCTLEGWSLSLSSALWRQYTPMILSDFKIKRDGVWGSGFALSECLSNQLSWRWDDAACDSCDVFLTAQMDKVWTTAASVAKYNISLSYIATPSGVLRVYPGVNSSALLHNPLRYAVLCTQCLALSVNK